MATIKVDMTPAGMTTPEGIARVEKAIKAQEDAITHVANEAAWFVRDYQYDIVADAKRRGDEAMVEALDSLRAAIVAREKASEEFLLALAGRK